MSLSQKKIVARGFVRSACMGVFLGSMYYQIDEGDVVSRILLFALVYLYLSIFLAEMLPGGSGLKFRDAFP
jgi:hypothetical protein